MDKDMQMELKNFEKVWQRVRSGTAVQNKAAGPELRLMPGKGKRKKPCRYLPYSP